MWRWRSSVVATILVGLVVFSCGTTKVKPKMTPEEQFEYAKKLFEKKDYLKAKEQFTILVLNYPGHSIADKAQFYLAETHFKLKEYVLAAAEYEKLIRSYSQSEYVDDAQYKIGMCYFKLSPNYALDQEYTHKAIAEFQRFLEDYPNSDLVPEVEKQLAKCREKLAKKEYKNGELYYKMAAYKAAIIYFDSVLENYYDTKYAPKALFKKAESLFKLKQYSESQNVFGAMIQKYPQSTLAKRAKIYLQKIEKLMAKQKKGKVKTSANIR